jgi:hypothetical protein
MVRRLLTYMTFKKIKNFHTFTSFMVKDNYICCVIDQDNDHVFCKLQYILSNDKEEHKTITKLSKFNANSEWEKVLSINYELYKEKGIENKMGYNHLNP